MKCFLTLNAFFMSILTVVIIIIINMLLLSQLLSTGTADDGRSLQKIDFFQVSYYNFYHISAMSKTK